MAILLRLREKGLLIDLRNQLRTVIIDIMANQKVTEKAKGKGKEKGKEKDKGKGKKPQNPNPPKAEKKIESASPSAMVASR